MPLLPKTVVGIEFHDHLAQFVALKRRRRSLELESLNRVSIPTGVIEDGEIKKEDVLKKTLVDFFTGATPALKKIKHAAVVLPARVTFVHIFNFPASFSEKEIRNALPYQAETVIPFAIEDVYWDFSILETGDAKKKGSNQIILFAAVPKALADKYAKVLEYLGVTPFLFGVHVEALQFALQEHLENEQAHLIIDIGSIAANYLLMQGKTLKYFFSSNEGTDDLIAGLEKQAKIAPGTLYDDWEEQKDSKRFSANINTFIKKRYKQASNIVKQQGKKHGLNNIQNIHITGEFATLPNFLRLAKIHFPKQKVFVGDPKQDLQVKESKFSQFGKKKKGGRIYSVFFTNVLGIAREALMSPSKKRINLLPSSLQVQFNHKKINFFMELSILFITIFSLVIAGLLVVKHQGEFIDRLTLESQKANVDRTLYGTRYQEITAALTEFNDEVDVLTSIDRALFSVPASLEELISLLPEGIELTKLEFIDETISVEISGVAATRELLLEFQQIIEESDYVADVELPLSNFDEKTDIFFMLNVTLNFTELPSYAADPTE